MKSRVEVDKEKTKLEDTSDRSLLIKVKLLVRF